MWPFRRERRNPEFETFRPVDCGSADLWVCGSFTGCSYHEVLWATLEKYGYEREEKEMDTDRCKVAEKHNPLDDFSTEELMEAAENYDEDRRNKIRKLEEENERLRFALAKLAGLA